MKGSGRGQGRGAGTGTVPGCLVPPIPGYLRLRKRVCHPPFPAAVSWLTPLPASVSWLPPSELRLAGYPPSLLRQADEVAAEVANGLYPANGQPTVDAFADETG